MGDVLQLSGKKALVTGGAVRIGRFICEALARAGCDVAVHYRSSASEAALLVAQLVSCGVRACSVQADLENLDDVQQLVPSAADALAGLDILINNASVFHKDNLLASSPDVLAHELGVNALAPIALMRAFATLHGMHHTAAATEAWPDAAIINILDRRVTKVEPGALPYNLSKRMLRDATCMAALELGPGIRVNAVAPGPILPPPGEGDSYLAERAGPMVLAKRPRPEDVANAVMFLLQAEGITGQVLYVDSGQHLL
ncbi:MAG: SDR family oxidoreductase [Kiritimatiellia bacterium]